MCITIRSVICWTCWKTGQNGDKDYTMNANAQGRSDLAAWEESKPDNFFTADANLRAVLRRVMGDAGYTAFEPQLTAFGAQAATVLDIWAKQEDQIGSHPKLDRYDGIGRRTENIV